MRNDIITATLPAGPLDDMIAKVEAEHLAKAAAAQDSAMIERDLSRGARPPAPVAEDPLAEVREAIDTALWAAANDGNMVDGSLGLRVAYVLNAVRKLLAPSDPDAEKAKQANQTIREILNPPAGQVWGEIKPTPELANGLLVEHKPGARVKGGAL